MFSRQVKNEQHKDGAPSAGEPSVRRDVQVVRFDPPRELRPAYAGVLLDGRMSAREVSAMLIDLSLRGWFAIEQDGKDWALVSSTLLPPRGDVASGSEELLMEALFRPGLTHTPGDAVARQYVSLASLKHRLQGHVEEITTALGQEMVDSGVATRHPGKRGMLRGRWLSDAGEALRSEADSFKHYLAKAETRQLANDQSEGFVGGYLAYAVAFELVGAWSEQLGEAGSDHPATAAGQMLAQMHDNPMLVGLAAASTDGFSLDDLYVLAAARNYGMRSPGRR